MMGDKVSNGRIAHQRGPQITQPVMILIDHTGQSQRRCRPHQTADRRLIQIGQTCQHLEG